MRTEENLLKDLLRPVSQIQKIEKNPGKGFDLLPVQEQEFERTITKFEETIKKESTVLDLFGPITVVGDLHGQLLDLYRILHQCGSPPTVRYLFLGDLVDRGEFSIEVLMIVCLFKILYSNSVYVIRGNHEFDFMCETNGFEDEVQSFYGKTDVLPLCYQAFSYLPIGAKINQRVLCVHGGIGPQVRSIDNIVRLSRPLFDSIGQVSESILWSDPTDHYEYFEGSSRGSGNMFGKQALKEFLDVSNLKKLVRGHECVEHGYEQHFDGICITVFSASNYCGMVGNKGAVLTFEKDSNFKPIVFEPMPWVLRGTIFKGGPVRNNRKSGVLSARKPNIVKPGPNLRESDTLKYLTRPESISKTAGPQKSAGVKPSKSSPDLGKLSKFPSGFF